MRVRGCGGLGHLRAGRSRCAPLATATRCRRAPDRRRQQSTGERIATSTRRRGARARIGRPRRRPTHHCVLTTGPRRRRQARGAPHELHVARTVRVTHRLERRPQVTDRRVVLLVAAQLRVGAQVGHVDARVPASLSNTHNQHHHTHIRTHTHTGQRRSPGANAGRRRAHHALELLPRDEAQQPRGHDAREAAPQRRNARVALVQAELF